MSTSDPTAGYAPVNGLRMYYEVHGEAGAPFYLARPELGRSFRAAVLYRF